MPQPVMHAGGALLADLIIRSERSSAELAKDAMRQFPQALINVPVNEQTSELPAKVQEVIEEAEDRIANHGRVLLGQAELKRSFGSWSKPPKSAWRKWKHSDWHL